MDDTTHMSVYFVAGFDNNAGPDYNNMNDFGPMGALPYKSNVWFEVWVTDLQIISTDPANPYYIPSANRYRPVPLTGVNGNSLRALHAEEEVCGFVLYRASATPNGADWNISTDFALPTMHQGQFCVSASFMDNPAVWLVNAERYDGSNDLPSNSGENTNYIVIGANNPTLQWDNALSRCTFAHLHIPKILGVEDLPTKDGEVVQATIVNWVVKVTDTNIKYRYIWEFLRGSKNVQEDDWTINGIVTNRNYLLNYNIGGISIDSMYGESTTTNNTDLHNMTLLTKDNWGNCLLFGEPTKTNDCSKIKSADPAVRYEKLKPLTTNPLIDISSATSLPVQDGTVEQPNPSDEDNPYEQVGMGLPTYSLIVWVHSSRQISMHRPVR